MCGAVLAAPHLLDPASIFHIKIQQKVSVSCKCNKLMYYSAVATCRCTYTSVGCWDAPNNLITNP